MTGDFTLFDRLSLAFQVISSWEVLATLGSFVALWLLVRYVADPWRSEAQRRDKPRMGAAKSRMGAAKPSAPPAGEASSEDLAGDSEDTLPD